MGEGGMLAGEKAPAESRWSVWPENIESWGEAAAQGFWCGTDSSEAWGFEAAGGYSTFGH